MDKNVELIIAKTKELSALIESHEISKKYNELKTRVSQDNKSRLLLEKMIILGHELSSTDEDQIKARAAENELIRQEFNENGLIRDFIIAQKEYISMLKTVGERIKNPENAA